MRQLCCHPQVIFLFSSSHKTQISESDKRLLGQEPKTLEQIKSILISDAEVVVSNKETEVVTLKEQIATIQLSQGTDIKKQFDFLTACVVALNKGFLFC